MESAHARLNRTTAFHGHVRKQALSTWGCPFMPSRCSSPLQLLIKVPSRCHRSKPPLASDAWSLLSRLAVIRVTRKQRPGNARILVGDGYRGGIPPSALLQIYYLATAGLGLTPRVMHRRSCSMNQQRPEVAIAPFADAEQSLLAARGVLSGH